MELRGPLCSIRPLQIADLEDLLALRLRNRDIFTPLEPRKDDPGDGYTEASLSRLVDEGTSSWETGRDYPFGVFADGALVGRVALSNVVRGAWQSCTIGYYVDASRWGRGYATEAVRLAVSFALDHEGLHRVQGAVMPRNAASVRVLEKAGFRDEGYAHHYLQINGVWEDHHIFAITREAWLEMKMDAGTTQELDVLCPKRLGPREPSQGTIRIVIPDSFGS